MSYEDRTDCSWLYFGSPPLNLLPFFDAFLVLGAQNWKQYGRCHLRSREKEVKDVKQKTVLIFSLMYSKDRKAFLK